MNWESDTAPRGPVRYTTIAAAEGRGVDLEFEVRRSRFLTRLRRVSSEDAARTVIDERRRTHFDARHHCTAFILGPEGRTARSSDDGEPVGTAGVPMLTVLQRTGLSDVVAVVTRYFGGIKLGAGGLVRAYSDAVARAVEAAGQRQVVLAQVLAINVPMAEAGLVEAQLRNLSLPSGATVTVDGVEWAEEARISVAVADDAVPELETALASLSGGFLRAQFIDRRWVDADA